MSERLDAAIANAQRGHRITEWENVAHELVAAVREDRAATVTLADKGEIRGHILGEMQAEVIGWAITKGWHGPDAPEVRFGEAMALLHSEVSEALEAFRTHGVEDFTLEACSPTRAHLDGSVGPTGHQCKPEGVGSEFADILIRLLHYSELFGVNLATEYERKMAYNHTRAFRHGGRAL